MYGKGISREGSLLDLAVDLGIVKKSGAWFTYDGEQLGQGRENAKMFLAENPEIMVEISDRVLQQRSASTTSRAGASPPPTRSRSSSTMTRSRRARRTRAGCAERCGASDGPPLTRALT